MDTKFKVVTFECWDECVIDQLGGIPHTVDYKRVVFETCIQRKKIISHESCAEVMLISEWIILREFYSSLFVYFVSSRTVPPFASAHTLCESQDCPRNSDFSSTVRLNSKVFWRGI